MAPIVSAECALGASSPQVAFAAPDQCVVVTGQRLKFATCSAPLEPDETRWHAGNTPHGVALVATCPKAGVFAFTERTQRPAIEMCTYPDMMPKCTLEFEALEFTAMAFLRNGKQFAALTGLPQPTLVVWSMDTLTVLVSVPLAVPCDSLSFNPGADGLLCTQASKKLTMWRVKLVYETHLVSSAEVVAPEMPPPETPEAPEAMLEPPAPAAWTCHAWSQGGSLYAGTESGAIVAVPGKGVDMGFTTGKAEPSTYKPEPETFLQLNVPVRALLADGTHLVVGTADGLVTWFSLDQPYMQALDGAEVFPLWSCDVNAAVGSLTYSPDYLRVLATTAEGEVHYFGYVGEAIEELPTQRCEVLDVLQTGKVAAFHTAPVVAASVLPLMENGAAVGYDIVTCSADGTLRCTNAQTRLEVARITTASPAPPTAVCACAASMLVALGTGDGVIRLYQRQLEDFPLLSLGYRARLSRAALTKLAFSADGAFLAASDADGMTLILSLPASGAAPTVVTSFTTSAPPVSLAWTAAGKLLLALSDATVILYSAADEVPPSLAASPSIKLQSAPISIVEAPASYDGCSGNGNTTFFALCADKSLHVYEIPKGGGTGSLMDPHESYVAHEKEPSAMALSLDGSFLATVGKDGQLSVRDLAAISEPTKLGLHDSVMGGATCVTIVPDHSPAAPAGSQLLYTCGMDSVMFMSTAKPAFGREAPLVTMIPRAMALPADIEDTPAVYEGAPTPAADEDVDEAAAELTVLEAATIVSAGAKVSSAASVALADKVEALRAELQGLLTANDNLPEDEKLKSNDFIIDLPQQSEWREAGSEEVAELKDSILHDNLVNDLVQSRMKEEFYKMMEKPGFTLHAIPVPGTSTAKTATQPKVSSYTVPKPKSEVTSALERVQMLRKVELDINKFEAADAEPSDTANGTPPSTFFENAASFAKNIGRVRTKADQEKEAAAAAAEKEAADAAAAKAAAVADGTHEEEEKHDDDAGAAGAGAAGDSSLLYASFELHTKWRKVAQIVLHGEQQVKLQMAFNEQLDHLLKDKEAELNKVKEKQVRIREIEAELAKLGSQGDGEETLALGFHDEEMPEKIIEVKDAEIMAPKFISPEERERLAKLEAEKRAREEAEAGDTLGKRGLRAMMNGTLETRKDEDEIFTDLVKPEWMDEKPADELTDDEKAEIKEFAERVKKLEAEREKRSKALMTELTKLREDIVETCKGFNDKVVAARDTKMLFDSAVYECELMVIRLSQSRLSDETYVTTSAALASELQELQDQAGRAADRLAEFKMRLGAQTETMESLAAEDKALDKAFKRDFADVPEFFEPLKKLYSRRKFQTVRKGTKAASEDAKKPGAPVAALPGAPKRGGSRASAAMMVAVQTGASAGDDGEDLDGNPAAAGRDPFVDLDAPETEQVVEPLDAAVDMPDGLSFDVWDRLVEARNAKIGAEEELKKATTLHGEMSVFHALLFAEDERIRSRIEELTTTLSSRQAEVVRGAWNLELPFKFKQGQVEVEEAAVVTDYGDALLIHRSEVAELNKQIRQLGGEKVGILKEIRDFRKGIVSLQWESARADMEADDLVARTKEFQLLRVTKDLQGKIRGGGEDNHAAEVSALEKKLEQLKAAHEDKVADLRRQVTKIGAQVSDKTAEMESLQGQIEQLEGSVLEREMIFQIQSKNDNGGAGDGYKRFEELHMKRKLQTLVGMQTQEIGLLREELDRLRRRTFPTFTHIDHQALTDRSM